MRWPSRGLTLLELLCCVAIVAVLAACAVPTHRAAAQRTRRVDARVSLLRLASLQERHYFQHGRFAASFAELGDAMQFARSTEGYYRLELQGRAEGQGFVLLATPAAGGPQAGDGDCAMLSVDEAGRRAARGSSDADRRCWN